MPGFWICQDFEYTRFTQATVCSWMSKDSSSIDLFISENARILNTNLILLLVVSLRSQFSILEKSAKRNLDSFCKMLYGRCLTGRWICFRCSICQGWEYGSASKYARVLYIPVLRIFEGCEYTIVPNMRWFWIFWVYTGLWMYLNISG